MFFRKLLTVFFMSALGVLLSLNNSWVPIEIKTNKNVSSLKSANDFWICEYINEKYFGFENYKIEAKRRNLNCKSTNSIGYGSLYKVDINEKKITDKDLCRYATDPARTRWTFFERDKRFVDEAKRRGLDCGVNDNKTIIASNLTKNPVNRPQANVSD